MRVSVLPVSTHTHWDALRELQVPFFFPFMSQPGQPQRVVEPTSQNWQVKLRHMDALEPTFYQNILLSETKDQDEETSVLQGCLLDVCLCWRCGGWLLRLSGREAGLNAQGTWGSNKPLLFFSTALGCVIPCPVQDTAVCPGRWGRLTSFHFLLQGGFGDPRSLWWSLWMLLNPTSVAGTSSKFSNDVPAYGSSGIVCAWRR